MGPLDNVAIASKRGARPSQRASSGALSIGGNRMYGTSKTWVPAFAGTTGLALLSIAATARHLGDETVTGGHYVGFLAGQHTAARQGDAPHAAVRAAGASARRVVAPVEGGAGDAEGGGLGVFDLDHRAHAAALAALAARAVGEFAP